MDVQICVGQLLSDVELYVALTVDLELIREKEVAIHFVNVGVDPMRSCHSVVQPRKSIRVRLILDANQKKK